MRRTSRPAWMASLRQRRNSLNTESGVGIELLERVTFKARDRRSNEPLCLAHLNHCDQRAVLIKGGKGFACIKGW